MIGLATPWAAGHPARAPPKAPDFCKPVAAVSSWTYTRPAANAAACSVSPGTYA